MSLFEKIPNSQTNGATLSSAAPEASLGFWQRNRKGVFLFGGCLVLLLASRAYTGRARESKKAAKVEKLAQASNREEADKDNTIAGLRSRFAAEQEKREAVERENLAAAMATPQLTAAQLESLGRSGAPAAEVTTQRQPALAGGQVTSGGNSGTETHPSYNSAETGAPPLPEKVTTLVISYRGQDGPAAAPPAPVSPTMEPLPPGFVLPAPQTPGPGAPLTASREGADIRKSKANPEDAEHALAVSTGEKYRVREGTWVPCTEELRINGTFASDINCLVSIPMYSVSGNRLLIPQGTLALGHVASVGSQNQQRLFVVFDRFIMPDGYTLTYDNATGLDQIGQAGLRDQVNHHYLQMFGASVAIAAIGGLAQIGNYGNTNVTASSQYRSGLTQGMSESSTQILNRFSSVLPTFVIREGARNNIHLPFNLWLPDYSKHHMGGEL